jgi:hypothetical protein
MRALRSRARAVVICLATDRWLLLSALALVWAARVGLWVLPVRTVARCLGRVVPGRPARTADPALADRVARAVARASRVVPGATCLTQALVAQALLGWHGLATRLRIGVVRDAEQGLRGHAWLEGQDGIVVGKDLAGQWRPLLPVDAARPSPFAQGGRS